MNRTALVPAAIVALGLTVPLGAQDKPADPRDDIRWLLRITGDEEAARQLVRARIDEVLDRKPGAPATSEKEARELAALTAEVGRRVDDALVESWSKRLAPEDVKEVVKFLESPAGRRWLIARSDIARDSIAPIDSAIKATIVPKKEEIGPAANEAAAIATLKAIATAQSIFREGDRDGNGALDYGTLQKLAEAKLVDEILGKGTKQGYVFETFPSAATSEFLWFARAYPEKPGATGNRYFFTNQAAVIFEGKEPFEVNAKTCDVPRGLEPIGKTK